MSQQHILIVDDDASLRRVIQVQLEHEGYAVSTAASGPEALQILGNTVQDLVITDLRMPGMSGIELLRQIRADHPGVAVIIITAYGSREIAVEATKSGTYDYIMKPANPDALRLIVSRALEHLGLRGEEHTSSFKG